MARVKYLRIKNETIIINGMTIDQPRQKELRKARYSSVNNYYFITIVTRNRIRIFNNEITANIVINTLNWLEQNKRINLESFVIMPDHVHFVAQLKDSTLSKLIHSLKSYSANEINKSIKRKGPVWDRGYFERGIRNEKSLIEIIKYCLHNPIRKGMVEDFKDYPFWYCKYDI